MTITMMKKGNSMAEEKNQEQTQEDRKGDVTLDYIIEQEMLEMGLDPRNKNDVQKFWEQKGLLG